MKLRARSPAARTTRGTTMSQGHPAGVDRLVAPVHTASRRRRRIGKRAGGLSLDTEADRDRARDASSSRSSARASRNEDRAPPRRSRTRHGRARARVRSPSPLYTPRGVNLRLGWADNSHRDRDKAAPQSPGSHVQGTDVSPWHDSPTGVPATSRDGASPGVVSTPGEKPGGAPGLSQRRQPRSSPLTTHRATPGVTERRQVRILQSTARGSVLKEIVTVSHVVVRQ